MKKKLIAIFGPLILAAVLLAVFFFSPLKINPRDPNLWQEASSSMSGNILRGDTIKNEAIKSGKYVPFFGSSELSRISPFHPSVLAEKYHRDYTPFLLGAPGTQSLTQFMMMQSLGDSLKNRKVVFVISPQWFVRGGVSRQYFDAYFSELQTYSWVTHLEQINERDVYLAKRLLKYDRVTHDDELKSMLEAVSQKQKPSDRQVAFAKIHMNMLRREDEIFSEVGLFSKNAKISAQTKKLPPDYDWQQLTELADEIGEKSTNNNSFAIENHFYNTRIKSRLAKLNDSQTDWDYRYSTEFSDFQLVLDQLAAKKTEALFVIPPINEKWAAYTGLSHSMLNDFAKKITYQLRSQGFEHIADFTDLDRIPYFMEDTIHLGWRGWLEADQYIKPFLSDLKADPVHYRMNDYFLSEDWQEKNPDTITEK